MYAPLFYSIFCLTFLQTNNLGGRYLLFKGSDDSALESRRVLLRSDTSEVCRWRSHPLRESCSTATGFAEPRPALRRGLQESDGRDLCLMETGVGETNKQNPQTHSVLIDLLLFLICVCKWH